MLPAPSAIETDLQPLYGQASNVIFSWHVRVVRVDVDFDFDLQFGNSLHNNIA